MRAAIAIALMLGTACAGGDLATSSFGGDDNGTEPFDTGGDTRPPDDTTDGSASVDSTGASATADDTTTSTSGDPDTGSSSSDTGEECLEEICDGLDNVCDDDVDEGCRCAEGDTQQCYSGPPETIG